MDFFTITNYKNQILQYIRTGYRMSCAYNFEIKAVEAFTFTKHLSGKLMSAQRSINSIH